MLSSIESLETTSLCNHRGLLLEVQLQFNASEYCPCIETPDVMKFPLAVMEEENNDKDFGSY